MKLKASVQHSRNSRKNTNDRDALESKRNIYGAEEAVVEVGGGGRRTQTATGFEGGEGVHGVLLCHRADEHSSMAPADLSVLLLNSNHADWNKSLSETWTIES